MDYVNDITLQLISMEAQPVAAEKLWGAGELADQLGYTRQYVSSLIKDGEFNGKLKIGNSYVVPQSDVLDFIESRIEELKEEFEKELDRWRKIRHDIESGAKEEA